MSTGRIVAPSATLAVGLGVAGGLFWALLNVPESNVAALTLSASLVLLIAGVVGLTVAAAAGLSQGLTFQESARRAPAALPGFLLGLAAFAVIWWITGSAGGWWRTHRGEADAVIIRYFGKTGTGWLHESVFWSLWLIRWALGLALVGGLLSTLQGLSGTASGFRLSVRPVPLGATALGVIVVAEGLWRLVYWRPMVLPHNWVEPAFAVLKVGVLYVVAATIAAVVLQVFGRETPRG